MAESNFNKSRSSGKGDSNEDFKEETFVSSKYPGQSAFRQPELTASSFMNPSAKPINRKKRLHAAEKSNKSDKIFDEIIGHIEDIVMDEEFQEMQNEFFDKYCMEFTDEEENKLIYTDIHKKYTDLIEKHLERKLCELMPGFNMTDFYKQLAHRRDELDGEIFEMLLSFSDFLSFKEMCLAYRADKEGRTVDFSSGFIISPLNMGDDVTRSRTDRNSSAANRVTELMDCDDDSEETGSNQLSADNGSSNTHNLELSLNGKSFGHSSHKDSKH